MHLVLDVSGYSTVANSLATLCWVSIVAPAPVAGVGGLFGLSVRKRLTVSVQISGCRLHAKMGKCLHLTH